MTKPVEMEMWCPNCRARHVDSGEWAARPHRTHLCDACGFKWGHQRHATVGIAPPSAPAPQWRRRERLDGDPLWIASGPRSLVLQVNVQCEWVWMWDVTDSDGIPLASGDFAVYPFGSKAADEWDCQDVRLAQSRCEAVAAVLAAEEPTEAEQAAAKCKEEGHLPRVQGDWPEDAVCPRCGDLETGISLTVSVVPPKHGAECPTEEPVYEECPGCGLPLPEFGGLIEDGRPLSCGCDGRWNADGDAHPSHDDDCRQCAEENGTDAA